MENICICNNCNQLFIDTNSQVGAERFDISNLSLEPLIDHKCPVCNTDDFLDDKIYRYLWEEVLGIMDINDEEEIVEPFLHFPKGTFREDIWH